MQCYHTVILVGHPSDIIVLVKLYHNLIPIRISISNSEIFLQVIFLSQYVLNILFIQLGYLQQSL